MAYHFISRLEPSGAVPAVDIVLAAPGVAYLGEADADSPERVTCARTGEQGAETTREGLILLGHGDRELEAAGSLEMTGVVHAPDDSRSWAQRRTARARGDRESAQRPRRG